jgi:hypothetical protein
MPEKKGHAHIRVERAGRCRFGRRVGRGGARAHPAHLLPGPAEDGGRAGQLRDREVLRGELRGGAIAQPSQAAALARLLERAGELPVSVHALEQSVRIAAQYDELPQALAEGLSKTQHAQFLLVADSRKKLGLGAMLRVLDAPGLDESSSLRSCERWGRARSSRCAALVEVHRPGVDFVCCGTRDARGGFEGDRPHCLFSFVRARGGLPRHALPAGGRRSSMKRRPRGRSARREDAHPPASASGSPRSCVSRRCPP